MTWWSVMVLMLKYNLIPESEVEKKNWSKVGGSEEKPHVEWSVTGLESEHQQPLHTDIFRKWTTTVVVLVSGHLWTKVNIRRVVPGLKRKKNWTVAQSFDQSKFCISFGSQSLWEEWSDTESKFPATYLPRLCFYSLYSAALALFNASCN